MSITNLPWRCENNEVYDGLGNLLATCPTPEAAAALTQTRLAALAAAAWIFGGSYRSRRNPPLEDVRPDIELAVVLPKRKTDTK